METPAPSPQRQDGGGTGYTGQRRSARPSATGMRVSIDCLCCGAVAEAYRSPGCPTTDLCCNFLSEEDKAMATPKKYSKPSKDTEDAAMYITTVVRNAIDDFHCRYWGNKTEH